MALGVVTVATWSRATPVRADAFSALKLASTTAEVRAEPSLNLIPGRSVMVHVSKVALLVMDWARYGWVVPSAATAMSGS